MCNVNLGGGEIKFGAGAGAGKYKFGARAG